MNNEQTVKASTAESSSFLERQWQKLVAVAIWVLIIGGLFTYLRLNNLTLRELVGQLIEVMQSPWGPLLYTLIYAIRPFTFFSATVLTLASGALFGHIWGIIYTVIASNISATVAYFMGQVLGKGLLDGDNSPKWVQQYANRMRDNSFETTLIMRFVFLPYDLVSYLAGILKIDYKAFILATILGSIPGTVSFVLAGTSVRVEDIAEGNFSPQFNPWSLLASVAVLVASLLFSRYLRQREEKKAK